jgi:hypothetical protein
MAYTLSLSEDERVLTCVYEGSVSLEELRQSIRDRLDYGDGTVFDRVRYIVTDYTEGSMKLLSRVDVLVIARMAKEATDRNPNFSVIGILPGQLEFGIGRILQARTDILGLSTYIVRNRTECEDLIIELDEAEAAAAAAEG